MVRTRWLYARACRFFSRPRGRTLQFSLYLLVFVLRQYPSGYQVAVTGPATVTSPPDAPLLELESTGAGQVTVAMTRR